LHFCITTVKINSTISTTRNYALTKVINQKIISLTIIDLKENMKILTSVILLTTLAGCASAPPNLEKEARQTLKGNCLTLFLNPSYQYISMVNGRTAFALADSPEGQICGAANNHDLQDGLFINLPPIDRLEALAIERCERAKSFNNKTPCKLYARGTTIVWGKSSSSGLK
jgi:hypothetical protein